MGKSYQKAQSFSSREAHHQLVQRLEVFGKVPTISIRSGEVEGRTSAFGDSAGDRFDVGGRFQNQVERGRKGRGIE